MTSPAYLCGRRLAVVLLAFTGASGRGADPPAAEPRPGAVTVADVQLGMHAWGEQLAEDALLHRIVLLTLIGENDKASREILPLLEETHRGLGPAGLLVVATQMGRPAPAPLRAEAVKRGLTLPLYDGGTVKGLGRPKPPHALLFDHTGRCIASGSPREMAARAKAAVGEAPPIVLAGRHLTKLKFLEAMLRDEAKYVAAFRKAESLVESDDPETAADAAYLVERLTARGEALLATAKRVRTQDAAAAAAVLERTAAAFRGLDAGRQAGELQREWMRDEEFRKGLQAASLTAQLEALRTQALTPPPATRPGSGRAPRPPAGQGVAKLGEVGRAAPQLKSQMAQLAARVRQLAPGTTYALRAEAIALEFGLPLPAGP